MLRACWSWLSFRRHGLICQRLRGGRLRTRDGRRRPRRGPRRLKYDFGLLGRCRSLLSRPDFASRGCWCGRLHRRGGWSDGRLRSGHFRFTLFPSGRRHARLGERWLGMRRCRCRGRRWPRHGACRLLDKVGGLDCRGGSLGSSDFTGCGCRCRCLHWRGCHGGFGITLNRRKGSTATGGRKVALASGDDGFFPVSDLANWNSLHLASALALDDLGTRA